MEREEGTDGWNVVPGSRSAAAASDLRHAVETGEREMAELRAIVARKGKSVCVWMHFLLSHYTYLYYGDRVSADGDISDFTEKHYLGC